MKETSLQSVSLEKNINEISANIFKFLFEIIYLIFKLMFIGNIYKFNPW
jgi:hypothetical protein